MKIIIFGMGEIYRKNRDKISQEDEITAFIDNNEQLWGTECDGIKIFSPTEINRLAYEKIVIMSIHCIEMRNQLVQLGCYRESILLYTEYNSMQSAGQLSVYYGKRYYHKKKKCLIVTNPLGYHGGAIVAAYTALALQNKGYEVVVVAPEGDKKFIKEFSMKGIIFAVYPNLQFAKWEELFWIKEFDRVIVNTYPMVLCAIEIAKHREVVFWLHENDIAYPVMEYWKDIVMENISLQNLRIFAVSNVAGKNFCNNVMEHEMELLPYGIPDVNKNERKLTGKLTFAMIGTIHPVKHQLLFLEAVRQLNKKYQDCEYLIIGNHSDVAEYVQRVEEEAEEISNVYVTGGLTRKELEGMYSRIDVLVATSLQETMSLAATEAMMYGKVCIISDIAGMAQYVRQGENGFIFQSDNVDDLVDHMSFCIENREHLQIMGENARKTYCKYFTMEVLENRLEQILHQESVVL